MYKRSIDGIHPDAMQMLLTNFMERKYPGVSKHHRAGSRYLPPEPN